MKLATKTRRGARVYRRYDIPRTPFQRLLERTDVSQLTKHHLQLVFDRLNPAQLRRELTELQDRLYQLASGKPAPEGLNRGLPIHIHLD